MIFSGGSSFYLLGMELGFGCTPACLLPHSWRSLRMQQVQLASVPILGANGFMVPDQQCRPGNLSHTKRSWRSWWARKHVLFRSDNEAVVAILTTRTSKVPALMHLLRDLLLSAARWGLLSLLLIFLELRTKLLMLSLVSVGRISGSWLWRLICPLVRFLSSCWTA